MEIIPTKMISSINDQNNCVDEFNLIHFPLEIICIIAKYCGLSCYKLALTCKQFSFLFEHFPVIPKFNINQRDWAIYNMGNLSELYKYEIDREYFQINKLVSLPNFKNRDLVIYYLEKKSLEVHQFCPIFADPNKFVFKITIDYFRSKYDPKTKCFGVLNYILYKYNLPLELICPLICDIETDFIISFNNFKSKRFMDYFSWHEMIRLAMLYRASKCFIFLIKQFTNDYTISSDIISKCIAYGTKKMFSALLSLNKKNWDLKFIMDRLFWFLYNKMNFILERLYALGFDLIDIIYNIPENDAKHLLEYFTENNHTRYNF